MEAQNMTQPRVVWIDKEYQISGARLIAKELAQKAGFSEISIAHLAIAVTELASNLFFHTTNGGSLSLTIVDEGNGVGIKVVSEDDGPGIADVPMAMREGYTTRGGMGGGLPGAERLMDEFALESVPGKGTCVTAVKWK